MGSLGKCMLLRESGYLPDIHNSFCFSVIKLKINLMKSKKSIDAWRKAKKLIPGGTQLLSKRAERFLPEQWPAYFKKAKGTEITDLDGNRYIDMSIMGIGACVLGYADEDVNKAVKKVIDSGNMATLNSPEEIELAEVLLKLHPWAQMVRYARTGGETAAIAIRIARAYTGKDKIAFCGYHGWQDWYLASNLSNKKNLDGHLLPGLNPLGVPRGLINTAYPFEYNKIEQLEKIVSENDIGVIIMEPFRHQEPAGRFLEKVRKIADRKKAVLIFDEISAGFRMNLGGTHLLFKVIPDIAIFAKAISNGYPMGAIIGKKEVMKVAEDSFISSTYWTERVGPAAALATIKKMKQKNVSAYLDVIGKMIGDGWKKLADKHGLDVGIIGPNQLITLSFNYPDSLAIRTLFTQEMLKRGFLASLTVYVSFAHTKKQVALYLKAVDEVFAYIKGSINEGKVESRLKGPVSYDGFKRLT